MINFRSVHGFVLVGAILTSLTLAPDSSGQTNTENFAQFEFNFNNPGARATGVGGAFISIADDATAAEANPAGLTKLIRPELSAEVKLVRFTRQVTNFSHTGTAASFQMVSRDFENSLVIPSFVSVVAPFGQLVGSLFRYELANFKTTYYTKGSYVPPLQASEVGDGAFFFPVNSDLTMKVVNWGGALSFRFSRYFSLGASFGLSQLSMTSRLSRYYLEVFDSGNIANEATISADDNSFFVNAGVLVRPMQNLTLGAILKYRPQFKVPHDLLITTFPTDTVVREEINFNIPSSIGIGVSYNPTDVLTLSFDLVGVAYSDLTKDFVLTLSDQYVTSEDYKVDDAIEFHVGAEYVLLTRAMGFVFRGGFYTEADNRIRFAGDPLRAADATGLFVRRTQAALFQEGEMDYHYTFGVGFLFSNNVQLDLAGNLSSGSDEVVASFVVRM